MELVPSHEPPLFFQVEVLRDDDFDERIEEGDWISIDGFSGEVFRAQMPPPTRLFANKWDRE